jgi:hypothetical protein
VCPSSRKDASILRVKRAAPTVTCALPWGWVVFTSRWSFRPRTAAASFLQEGRVSPGRGSASLPEGWPFGRDRRALPMARTRPPRGRTPLTSGRTHPSSSHDGRPRPADARHRRPRAPQHDDGATSPRGRIHVSVGRGRPSSRRDAILDVRGRFSKINKSRAALPASTHRGQRRPGMVPGRPRTHGSPQSTRPGKEN